MACAYLTVREVAERLGVSVSMVYKLIRQGRLEGYGAGRRKLIYPASLDAYRQRNAFSTTPAPAPAVEQPAPASRPKRAVKPLVLPAGRHLR